MAIQEENVPGDKLVADQGPIEQCFVDLEKSETELKDVEAALRETEEKYRNIYKNATEGIFQITPDGRFLSANPSLAKIHGYGSPEELMNTVKDIARQIYVDPNVRVKLMEQLNRDGSVQDFEAEMYRKDRSLHWISINIRNVKDENGKVLYHEGTMQDITQRKITEKALIESEERYRTAIEHSNDAVSIIQGNKHLYVNRRFVEMFEYNCPDDIVGQPLTLIVHPDYHELVININRKRRRGEQVPSRYEFKAVTRTGKLIYIEASATATTYRGQPVYLSYLRDITERKKGEDALRKERNRFQTLTESAPFGIAMIDNEGRYKYVNPKFRELFGYDLRDVPTGRDWFRMVFPDLKYRREAISSWADDIKNPKQGERTPRTYNVTCNDKTVKIINFIPVRLVTGEYLVSFEDITERVQAQETLIESHKELESLNRAKTKAVNHISHELKTPLAVIQGNIRILKRKLEDLPSRDSFSLLLETLERNLERLFDISKETDEIFHVSRELEASVVLDDLDHLLRRMEDISEVPEETRAHWQALREWTDRFLSGSLETFQSIDLLSFVRTTLERVKQAASHRNIQFQIEGADFLYIFMDPTILREIIEGLVKNGIENSPDGAKILINLEREDDRVWLRVADFGIGITEENQKYILDGLFHTKETEMYASKKPYDFGAGGKSFELLRMKTYGRRFGFDVSFKSTRCVYIPSDHDLCPGKISLCPHCRTAEECARSGGTTFSVSFPTKPKKSFLA
jgi:PAS domain S-box-containing protein